MFSTAFLGIDQFRRDTFKPNLKLELTEPPSKPSDLLFGGELEAWVKEIEAKQCTKKAIAHLQPEAKKQRVEQKPCNSNRKAQSQYAY